MIPHLGQKPLTASTCVAQSSVLLRRRAPGYILQLLPKFINVGHLASFIKPVRKMGGGAIRRAIPPPS